PVIEQMEAGRQEIPVAHAIAALAETDYPSSYLFDLVTALSQRGFTSKEFRIDVASALSRLAKVELGLPDSILNILEHWLSQNCRPDEQAPEETQEQRESQIGSILWDQG